MSNHAEYLNSMWLFDKIHFIITAKSKPVEIDSDSDSGPVPKKAPAASKPAAKPKAAPKKKAEKKGEIYCTVYFLSQSNYGD